MGALWILGDLEGSAGFVVSVRLLRQEVPMIVLGSYYHFQRWYYQFQKVVVTGSGQWQCDL